MSLHRENVIWQSADGTWSRGFYTTYPTGDPSSEDYDREWDVDYNYDEFWWASTGHPNVEAAERSWRGANPGGHEQVPYTPENIALVEECDDLAAILCESGNHSYHGPVRRRSLKALKNELERLTNERKRDERHGYLVSPIIIDRIAALRERVRTEQPAPTRPAKKTGQGKSGQTREGDLGVPSVNKGRYATPRKDEPARGLS